MEEDELNFLLGIVPSKSTPTAPTDNETSKRGKWSRELAGSQAVQAQDREPTHRERAATPPTTHERHDDRSSPDAVRSVSQRYSQSSEHPVKETHVDPSATWLGAGPIDATTHPPSTEGAEMQQVIEEEQGVKEKDFAESPTSSARDPAQAMLEALVASLSRLGEPPPPPTTNALDLLDRIQQQNSVKVEDDRVAETLPAESCTIAESVDPDVKPSRQTHVIRVHSRLPGSRRRRVGYRIVRDVGDAVEGYSADIDEAGADTDVAPEHLSTPPPDPPTPFQRNLQSTFSPATLAHVEGIAQTDNTMGNQLPTQFRDIFTAMSDLSTMVEMSNHLRRQLDLPLLSMRTDRVALRRAAAQMRLNLYTDLACALVLPLAPDPLPVTDDEEDKEKVERISLTPTSLTMLAKQMPSFFPKEKYAIKRFLADPDAPYGERKGKVVWTQGIGKIVGGDIMGPGFRGKVSNDGLVNVFVDHSNVLHGLTHHVYNQDSRSLPPRHLRTLSLPVLSLLLRRGRHTPHGSLHLVASSPLHQNLDPLVRLGWEVSIMKRVEVYEDDQQTSSAPASQSHPRAPGPGGGARRYREQGVDEMLHLKLLQALNAKPNPAPEGSTIVLATGDARGGQFNREGFVGGVREAIKRGWSVELWSFSDGLSYTWRDLKRKEKWDGRFTIRLFDEWAGLMVEAGEAHQ